MGGGGGGGGRKEERNRGLIEKPMFKRRWHTVRSIILISTDT